MLSITNCYRDPVRPSSAMGIEGLRVCPKLRCEMGVQFGCNRTDDTEKQPFRPSRKKL